MTDLLSIPKAAIALGVTPAVVRSAIRRGQLVPILLGDREYISQDAVEKILYQEETKG